MHKRVWAWLVFSSAILAIVPLGSVLPSLRGDDWKPITPQEMALQDDPMNRGASAIILYRESFSDDVKNFDREYYRIKILKEEGKKYANVEITFRKDVMTVEAVEARTVQPDGTIVEFKDKVYEKPYYKSRRSNWAIKTFALPAVQVGSILEYRYKVRRDQEKLFDSRWVLQRELSIREAHFSLLPYKELPISWVGFGIPSTQAPVQDEVGTFKMDLKNIAALVDEQYSPPEESLKARVFFFYIPRKFRPSELKTPDDFWRPTGKDIYRTDDDFLGNRREIQALANELARPADPPETRLRTLYARAQQVRNLSYERERTEKEEKKEKLKPNMNVGDVLKNGYGNGGDINYFFAALARAAGFDAAILHLTTRDEDNFELQLYSTRQLNSSLVHVRLGDQQWFLDPASRYAPFGCLRWQETASRGIRPEKDGYTAITTPTPKSANAVIERKADLRLDMEGALEGTARIVYSGQEAFEWRQINYEQDEIGHKKAMEDDVKGMLPGGATVELTNKPAWQTSADTLVAEFKIKIPGYAAATGRRLLLPLAVFQTRENYPFRAIRRIHPIILEHPFLRRDEVTRAASRN